MVTRYRVSKCRSSMPGNFSHCQRTVVALLVSYMYTAAVSVWKVKRLTVTTKIHNNNIITATTVFMVLSS